MPTDSPKSFDEMFSDIIEGNYTGLPSKANFQKFLQQLMTDMECDNSRDNQLFNLGCGTEEARSSFTHYFLNQKFKSGHLSNIFSFFSKYIIANKNTLADKNIKNLISLGTHYTLLQDAKINNANSTFSENDVITSSEFLSFLTSLLNVHNITEFETQQLIHTKGEGLLPNITFGDDQKIDMLVGHTNKLVTDLMARLDLKNYLHKEESFLNSLESLGDLGFQLKLKEEFADQADQIKNIAQTILSSPSSRNFTETFKISAAWAFLNRYHDKNAHDIETDCRYLFGFENCLPPDNENTRIIYEKILKNTIKPADLNTINYQLVIDKLSQGTPENIANQLNSLSGNNKLTNCINFFKDYLKQNNNTLNEIYLKKTFKLCNAINEIATASKTSLRNTANKLDIKYFKMIQAQLALVLNLVKSNSEEKSLHDQIHSISQLENLVIDVIENYHDHKYSNKTDENVKNIPKSYLDIINYSKDSDSSLLVSSNSFAKSIKEVTKACLNSEACNNTEIKKQSFEMLGGMVRKLDQVHRIHLAKEVINSAKELKNIIKNNNNISDAELGSDVANFLRIRHARNQILMDKDCMDIFGLNPQDCFPPITNNTNTTSPTAPTSAPPIIANATIAPEINQTTPTAIVNHNNATEIPNYFDNTTLNQTAATTENSIHDTASNPVLTLGASAAHGAIAGTVNGIIQYFANKYSQHGRQGSTTKAMLIYTTLLANAAVAATFPLMLVQIQSYINQGEEDQAQQLWDSMLLQALPTFISSVSLSLGLQFLNECTQLLSNDLVRSIVQNMLPLLGTAVSAIKNPLATGIQIGTSISASSLTLFGLTRCFPISHRHSAVAKEDINSTEMGEFNKKILKPSANTSDTNLNSKIFEELQYINDDKFNQIKKNSKDLKDSLEQLYASLKQTLKQSRSEISKIILSVSEPSNQKLDTVSKNIIQAIIQFQNDITKTTQSKALEKNLAEIWKSLSSKDLEKNLNEILQNLLPKCFKDSHSSITQKIIKTLKINEAKVLKIIKSIASKQNLDFFIQNESELLKLIQSEGLKPIQGDFFAKKIIETLKQSQTEVSEIIKNEGLRQSQVEVGIIIEGEGVKQSQAAVSKIIENLDLIPTDVDAIIKKIFIDLNQSKTIFQKIKEQLHVMNTIQQQLTDFMPIMDRLIDKEHQLACQKYIIRSQDTPEERDKIKVSHNSAMEKLGNVFKTMGTMLEQMSKDLSGVNGYVQGTTETFANSNIQVTLKDIIDNDIKFLLGLTKIYTASYCTWQVGKQGEAKGAKQALDNQAKFINVASLVTATSRPKINGRMTNRVCSMYSEKTLSSGSDTSGNSEFDPLVPQQKRELIHAKT